MSVLLNYYDEAGEKKEMVCVHGKVGVQGRVLLAGKDAESPLVEVYRAAGPSGAYGHMQNIAGMIYQDQFIVFMQARAEGATIEEAARAAEDPENCTGVYNLPRWK